MNKVRNNESLSDRKGIIYLHSQNFSKNLHFLLPDTYTKYTHKLFGEFFVQKTDDL